MRDMLIAKVSVGTLAAMSFFKKMEKGLKLYNTYIQYLSICISCLLKKQGC